MEANMRIAITLTLIMSALAFVVLGCSNPYERDNPRDPIFVYTITFNASDATGGTPPAALSGSWGDVVTLPEDGGFVRDGYVFKSWATPADGISYMKGSSYTITGNAAMDVLWSPLYTVTFDGNGATDGAVPEAITANYNYNYNGEFYWIPEVPGQGTLERTGYVFVGWAGNSSGTGYAYQPGVNISVSGDITLYAKWTPAYTVTFDGNGATGGTEPEAITVAEGSSIEFPAKGSLEKTGYAFDGWNTSSSGTETNYRAGSSYSPKGNVTIYAKWIPVYTVTFDGNGATGGTVPKAMTATEGSRIEFPAKGDLERTGYVFDSWNANSSGTGTNYIVGSSYIPTGNVTIYAKWLPVYTVTFDGNGATSGTAPVAMTATEGSSIRVPVNGNLEKTGYVFGGWNTDISGTGTDYAAGSSYIPTGNVTIYAKWLPASTVTFDGNGATSGTVPKPVTVADGSSIELPAKGNLERTGYAFDSWNTDISGTGTSYAVGSSYTVAEDITLYAVWASCYTDTHYCSNGTIKEYGFVTDNGGQTYKTVVIGTQTWMAENLNYNASGSKCYSNLDSNCDEYGRLYNWATAMALSSNCNSSSCSVQTKHRGICPVGWHIPSDADWDVLVTFAGGSSTAGTKLKAASGWNSNGSGTNNYGFSAMPGGYGDDNSFNRVGNYGVWWSTREYNVSKVYSRGMLYNYSNVFWGEDIKSNLFSVRCVKD
jgi:uncharacterized protein (TIGR02145 family)/uncharacterized repeat protein (TIGR02543 family)